MSEHSPLVFREWLVFKRAACRCGWVCPNRTKKHHVAMLDYREHKMTEEWHARAAERAERAFSEMEAA